MLNGLRVWICAVMCLGWLVAAGAQERAAASLPGFEVSVVKENKSGTNSARSMYTPYGISGTNVTVTMLLRQAYQLYSSNDDQIKGLPGWAEKKHFDFEAKVSESDAPRVKAMNPAERAAMLRAFLEDRFTLKAHRVIEDKPVYALVVAAGGMKLKPWIATEIAPNGLPASDARAGGSYELGDGHIRATGVDMAALTGMLTQMTSRTVIDKSGLKGLYSFTLDWTPDEKADVDAGKLEAPPLFKAIEEQLGLRLNPERGPVQGVVVDQIELPSGN